MARRELRINFVWDHRCCGEIITMVTIKLVSLIIYQAKFEIILSHAHFNFAITLK